MADLSEHVIAEAAHEGETLLVDDLVSLAERAHGDRPGIEVALLGAYADRLDDRRDVRLDRAAFREQLIERCTESETWVDADALYELDDDRLSLYPARWHDALGGSTDVTAYVEFLRTEAPEFLDAQGTAEIGPGIPQGKLLDIVTVIGRVDRETARNGLAEARDAGELVEDADQHPQAGVYLATEAGDLRDGTIDG